MHNSTFKTIFHLIAVVTYRQVLGTVVILLGIFLQGQLFLFVGLFRWTVIINNCVNH